MYMMRKQDYEKAREQSCKVESDILDKSSSSSALSKMDKKRKVEEEAMHKVKEDLEKNWRYGKGLSHDAIFHPIFFSTLLYD